MPTWDNLGDAEWDVVMAFVDMGRPMMLQSDIEEDSHLEELSVESLIRRGVLSEDTSSRGSPILVLDNDLFAEGVKRDAEKDE